MFNTTRFLEMERQKIVTDAQKARFEALEQQEAMRRELLRYTVQAQEDERARLSRELHDEMAQILTAFSLDLGTLQTVLPKNSRAAPILGRLQDLSRQMSQGMYRMVRALRPAHLDELGLDAALRYMIEHEYKPRGLAAGMEIQGDARRLDSFAETVLFRIAQEALTNILRHAHAPNAALLLLYERDSVLLRISDDGEGFDLAQGFVHPQGWGLAGIKERAESLGGTLRVDSAPGNGTVVEVVIPTGKS
jgi:signal transduction histidine kinase